MALLRLCDAEADFMDADVYIGRLLAHRIARATGAAAPDPGPPPLLSSRQAHDVRMVRADLAVADGNRAAARAAYAMVDAEAANPLTRAWARYGLAAVDHAETGDDCGLRRVVARADAPRLWLGHERSQQLTSLDRTFFTAASPLAG